jgi:Rieske Fe-S protein
MATNGMDRRTVLSGAAVAAAGAALTACGGGAAPAPAAAPSAQVKATAIGNVPPATAADPASEDAAGALNGIGNSADIPVGGGKIIESAKVVVTQPVAGTFKAFTAVCTHQGCLVSKVEDSTISCPCHGSQFSAFDGSVKQGPAAKPLAEQKLTVDNGTLKLGKSS